MENVNQFMTLEEFIKNRYSHYQIDTQNKGVISLLNLWANRDPNFEKTGDNFSLQKGWILTGNVGTGKTDIFKILRDYVGGYLKSNYKFSMHVTWEFATPFSKDGYAAFSDQEKGNRYYDELCLVDTRNPQPTREMVSHFGNKLLIGEELIMKRYNSLKQFGYQSHFSTNATPAQIKAIYGDRAFSRLGEMCNTMYLIGPDRRTTGNSPNIYVDLNNPVKKEVVSTPVSEQEHVENKARLDRNYQLFLETGVFDKLTGQLDYYPLLSYGCNLGGKEMYDSLTFASAKTYQSKQLVVGDTYSGEARMFINPTPFENEMAKKIHTETEAQAICVEWFYNNLKKADATSIFGEVSIDVDRLLHIEK